MKFPKDHKGESEREQEQWLCETWGWVYACHFKKGLGDCMLAYHEVISLLSTIECFGLVTMSSLDPFIL